MTRATASQLPLSARSGMDWMLGFKSGFTVEATRQPVARSLMTIWPGWAFTENQKGVGMVPLFIGLAVVAGLLLSRRRGAIKTVAGVTTAGVLAAAAAFVGPWEGLRTTAYLDKIASPAVWTVCYGETRGVTAADKYTAEQCAVKLGAALGQYRDQLATCIPALTVQPEGVQVALVSWAYNVGATAACGSTLARVANAGDWPAACDQLTRWNKAGGRVVAGLTNRRAAERALCLQSLKGI